MDKKIEIFKFIHIIYLSQLTNSMIEQNSSEVSVKIGIISVGKHISDSEREVQISTLRKSLIQQKGTDSDFKVITAIANTMIGSSIIVYPIIFIKDGMLGSLLVLLAIGAALFFTCRLLVVHNRDDETDFGQSIKRILGPKWAKLNSVVNITLLYIVSIAYFMLICGNFFDISAAIFTQVIDGYYPPDGKNLQFSKYSQQYASLICILFTAPLICKRDIQLLMKFFKFTIYLVFAYGIFIFVALIKVFANGELNFAAQYNLFNPDFSTVAGTFALSLLLHPVGAPILKRSANPSNNMRNLFLGYCLTALIYVYVGFLGGLTCAPEAKLISDEVTGDQYSTIFDCFKKGSTTVQNIFFVSGKIVQFGIFIQNLSVMPILSFLTRKYFLEQFSLEESKKKAFYFYNITMITFCLLVTIFQVDVTIVMSLNGAIVGFFMAYAIPIAAHLSCYHKKLTQDEKSQRSQLLTSVQSDNQTIEECLRCNNHPKRSRIRHLTIYGSLLAMGVAVACFKIYSLTET